MTFFVASTGDVHSTVWVDCFFVTGACSPPFPLGAEAFSGHLACPLSCCAGNICLRKHAWDGLSAHEVIPRLASWWKGEVAFGGDFDERSFPSVYAIRRSDKHHFWRARIDWVVIGAPVFVDYKGC